MTTTPVLNPTLTDRQSPTPPFGGNGGSGNGGFGGGGGDGAAAERMVLVGVWVALAPILMLFLAFASAYVVRRGLGTQWVTVDLPALVWLNTAMLAASSWALQRARGKLQRGEDAHRLLVATLGLGILFMLGQVAAWWQLRSTGVGMSGSPHGAFFYLLTGAHAVHLLGGVVALAAAAFWPEAGFKRLRRSAAVRVAAIYWHFMGALWLGLIALLQFLG